MCGYYAMPKAVAWASLGSPPRLRVLLVDWVKGCVKGRITPASAGTTGGPLQSQKPQGDHPRVCGYYNPGTLLFSSSTRITLACAGTTLMLHELIFCRKDHPRVCGYYVGLVLQGHPTVGITPACAGTTTGPNVAADSNWDHPRVCGYYIA